MVRMTPFNNPEEIEKTFTRQTFVTGLYIDYPHFLKLPKRGTYKAFFVLRDPRDIVVSAYYSLRYSHNPMGEVLTLRKALCNMSLEEGLIFVIEYLKSKNLFEALRSWTEAEDDDRILLVKYEDFAVNYRVVVENILSHCGIYIPQDVFDKLIDKYSFKRIRGKSTVIEDPASHYRKGKPGDWKLYFTKKVTDVFDKFTVTLVNDLGYK